MQCVTSVGTQFSSPSLFITYSPYLFYLHLSHTHKHTHTQMQPHTQTTNTCNHTQMQPHTCKHYIQSFSLKQFLAEQMPSPNLHSHPFHVGDADTETREEPSTILHRSVEKIQRQVPAHYFVLNPRLISLPTRWHGDVT